MKTIEENNLLIAEFMGGKFHKEDYANHSFKKAPKGMPINVDDKPYFCVGSTKYHESWDWLMPVVEKIEAIIVNDATFTFRISGTSAAIYNLTWPSKQITKTNEANKHSAVYQAVLKFIHWYNHSK